MVLAVIFVVACGKKGPPVVALKSKEVEVKGLKADPKGSEGVWLTWRVDRISEDLSGFLLLRGEEKSGATACRACPDFYTTIADLELAEMDVGEKKEGFAFLDENVQKDHHYYYQVQPKYLNGAVGGGVVVDIGISP
jgi:hypothetical protein